MIKNSVVAAGSFKSLRTLASRLTHRWVSDFAAADKFIDLPKVGRLFGFVDVEGAAESIGLRRTTKLQLFLLASWIASVLVLTLLAIVSVEISTFDFGWWTDQSSTVSTDPAILAKQYAYILQRPLFSRSRTMASVVAIPVAPTVPPPPRDRAILLKGVYINGNTAKAYLISQQSPLGVWVQVGQEIGAWKVSRISPGQIELQAENDQLVVLLGGREAGR